MNYSWTNGRLAIPALAGLLVRFPVYTVLCSWLLTQRIVPYIRAIVPEILRCIDFGVLAWNCLLTPSLGEFMGRISPIWRHPSSRLQKYHPWRSNDNITDFQDGGSELSWVCFGVISDHPRSVFCGLNSVLKSLVALRNSSEDIAMYRFRRFGLKLPIHAAFGEF